MQQEHRLPESLNLEQPPESRETSLPALRPDLRLFSAPAHSGGAPTWTLHDPVRARYYRIGWLEFELLSRWSLGDAQAVMNAVNGQTTLQADEEHVDALLQMLKDNELLQCANAIETAALIKHSEKPGRAVTARLFTASMFTRRKLINPDSILNTADRLMQPVYKRFKVFIALLVVLCVVAVWALVRHRFELHDTLADYLSPTGFAGFFATLVALNILHEFGHGLAAKRYGCRVTDMGIAFIFMIPVAYCDTSDAWRLKSNRQRLVIDGGGLIIEALVALAAVWAWLLLPDGMLRTLAFFVAVTSLATTLLINLNPFMKFDGYFLLSDMLGMENLQNRSFATLRWRLRALILGSCEAMPCPMSDRQRRIVQLYAAGTWAYRFFLYVGIAWLVYQFWFKALGIIMMLAVVSVMIIKPVLQEAVQLASIIKDQVAGRALHRRTLTSGLLVLALLLTLVVPLPRIITSPAVITSGDTTQLFSPRSARVASINVKLDQTVAKGDVIAVLDSSELHFELDTRKRQLELLRAQQRQQSSRSAVASDQWIDQEDIHQAEAAINEIQVQIDSLVLRSQSDGQVVRLDEWIQPGLWLEENTVVAEIADTQSTTVRAYVSESDVGRLQRDVSSASPTFVSQRQTLDLSLVMASISQDNIDSLADPALSVAQGGVIPAQLLNDQWTPLQGWHIATLKPENDLSLTREMTGSVRFQSTPVSLVSRGFDRLYGAVLRELSF